LSNSVQHIVGFNEDVSVLKS